MNTITVKHDQLTADDFIMLWESVWGGAPTKEQVELALGNSLFRVTLHDGQRTVAMARMIGDMGLCCYIKDVIVHPDYQGKGLGRMLINELLSFVKAHGISGTDVFVELAAVPDKMPFYEKLGFDTNSAQRLKMMCHID
ncbi:MAG TPA: GNAT family N-acetyltransferase [Ruminococcus sp.]|nr:GNAT family N-acetyltransferase [Ruminococcus sp.]